MLTRYFLDSTLGQGSVCIPCDFSISRALSLRRFSAHACDLSIYYENEMYTHLKDLERPHLIMEGILGCESVHPGFSPNHERAVYIKWTHSCVSLGLVSVKHLLLICKTSEELG